MRLIDADAFREHISVMGTYSGWNVIKEIDARPTVEPKMGKWKVVDAEEPRRYGCSQCKCLSFYAHIFCPCCGSRMEGIDETY